MPESPPARGVGFGNGVRAESGYVLYATPPSREELGSSGIRSESKKSKKESRIALEHRVRYGIHFIFRLAFYEGPHCYRNLEETPDAKVFALLLEVQRIQARDERV